MAQKSPTPGKLLLDAVGIAGFVLTALGFLGYSLPSILAALPEGAGLVVPSWLAPTSYTVAATATGALIALAVVRQRDLSIRHLPQGYVWTEARFDYHLPTENGGNHRQVTRVDVHATRNGVDLVEIRHQWSGSGDSEHPLKIVSGAKKVLGPFSREGYNVYYVLLNHELNRGGTASFKLTQEFTDSSGTFEPHLAKTAVEVIRKLVLAVHFSTEDPDESCVFAREFRGSYPTRIETRAKLKPTWHPSEKLLKLEVKRPRLNRMYDLRWDGTKKRLGK